MGLKRRVALVRSRDGRPYHEDDRTDVDYFPAYLDAMERFKAASAELEALRVANDRERERMDKLKFSAEVHEDLEHAVIDVVRELRQELDTMKLEVALSKMTGQERTDTARITQLRERYKELALSLKEDETGEETGGVMGKLRRFASSKKL